VRRFVDRQVDARLDPPAQDFGRRARIERRRAAISVFGRHGEACDKDPAGASGAERGKPGF
jgi:hypothetical protein